MIYTLFCKKSNSSWIFFNHLCSQYFLTSDCKDEMKFPMGYKAEHTILWTSTLTTGKSQEPRLHNPDIAARTFAKFSILIYVICLTFILTWIHKIELSVDWGYTRAH